MECSIAQVSLQVHDTCKDVIRGRKHGRSLERSDRADCAVQPRLVQSRTTLPVLPEIMAAKPFFEVAAGVAVGDDGR